MKASEEDIAKWKHWIAIIINDGKDLTEWEESFVDSISKYLDRYHYLTEKQQNILERIYADKTPT
jgi:hypothetical protein